MVVVVGSRGGTRSGPSSSTAALACGRVARLELGQQAVVATASLDTETDSSDRPHTGWRFLPPPTKHFRGFSLVGFQACCCLGEMSLLYCLQSFFLQIRRRPLNSNMCTYAKKMAEAVILQKISTFCKKGSSKMQIFVLQLAIRIIFGPFGPFWTISVEY